MRVVIQCNICYIKLFTEKLNESPEVVQNALEALIYLMIETNRYQVIIKGQIFSKSFWN